MLVCFGFLSALFFVFFFLIDAERVCVARQNKEEITYNFFDVIQNTVKNLAAIVFFFFGLQKTSVSYLIAG